MQEDGVESILSENSRFQKSGLMTRVGCSYRKGRRVSDPCAILTVRCSARAPRPRGAAQRYAPGCGEGRRSGALGAPGRRAAAPPRARRGTLRALRYAARPAARALRGGAAPGAVRCGARRAARAEHLTVSIAHGSLTRRPFLLQLFRSYLLPGFLPSLRSKGGPIGFQGVRIDSCYSIFELF